MAASSTVATVFVLIWLADLGTSAAVVIVRARTTTLDIISLCMLNFDMGMFLVSFFPEASKVRRMLTHLRCGSSIGPLQFAQLRSTSLNVKAFEAAGVVKRCETPVCRKPGGRAIVLARSQGGGRSRKFSY